MKGSISFLNCPFRERCQELRAELFCIHQKAVCEERKAQIAFNEELKRQKVVEETPEHPNPGQLVHPRLLSPAQTQWLSH